MPKITGEKQKWGQETGSGRAHGVREGCQRSANECGRESCKRRSKPGPAAEGKSPDLEEPPQLKTSSTPALQGSIWFQKPRHQFLRKNISFVLKSYLALALKRTPGWFEWDVPPQDMHVRSFQMSSSSIMQSDNTELQPAFPDNKQFNYTGNRERKMSLLAYMLILALK